MNLGEVPLNLLVVGGSPVGRGPTMRSRYVLGRRTLQAALVPVMNLSSGSFAPYPLVRRRRDVPVGRGQ